MRSFLKKLFAIRHTFKAYERLKREQHIDTLFRTGKAFSVFPVRVIYQLVPRAEDIAPARIGFSVPKKKFRKAVHRNRIRRLMREAWRLRKHTLYAALPMEKQLHIFLVFTDSSIPVFSALDAAMAQVTDKLIKTVGAVDA